jgi:hypothetical protein
VLQAKFRFLLSVGLAICLLPVAHAQKFETGWLSDQKGAVDPKTKATVVLASGLNGSQEPNGSMKWAGRYIGLEIPQPTINLSKLVLLGEDGKPLPHRHPEAFATTIGQSGEKGTFLKLFVDRPPGFKFKIRAE